ncbi:MAG: hypothetical protein LBF12_01060 [Christensenellaceae bacterium]|jgi:hypothetical protein|nr:hypothetical protein [Christensenellaceae bacterium]
MADKPSDINYNIVKEYGVLGETSSGWTKELNSISWNGRKERLDVREWAPNRERMGKGITLSDEEASKLYEILGKIVKK